MTSDPRDHLRQRREAMTAWERGLRPTTDRQWLQWLVLVVLVVFLTWRAGEWLLAQRPVAQPTAPPATVRAIPAPPPAAARAAPEPKERSLPKAESYGVTKCLTPAGKAEYSDGPCPAGSRARTVWVQPDVNLADGLSPAQRAASLRDNRVIAAEVQQYEQRVAQNTGAGVREACVSLDQHIKWIDAAARQPQSAWRQDELTRDRKESRDRQFRLRCQ